LGNEVPQKSAWSVIKEHKSQLFFFLLLVMVVPITLRFIREFNEVRAWMMNNFPEPSYGWPSYKDFYITAIGCFVSWIMMTVLNKLTWNMFYHLCKEKENEEIRIAKTQKSCDHFYKGFYFIISTVWGYLVMKDSNFLPRSLLGVGDLSHVHDNYPLVEWPAGLRTYYLFTMGYHLQCLLHHMSDHVRHDYMEMMLHHIVTMFLYGFSYLVNMTLGGAVVMYLHDIADIFT
jgi:hypothetical protein